MSRSLSSVALCALVLAVHCASECLALPGQSGECMFDQIARKNGPLPVAAVKEIPRRDDGRTWQAYTVSKGDAWKLMRIQTSIEPFRAKDFVCDTANSGAKVTNMLGQEVPCINPHSLRKHAEHLAAEVVERAVKLHTDRLFVRPFNGGIVVPEFGSDNFCSHFQIPKDHQSAGFSDSDMMLYVALTPIAKSHVLSVGAPCAVNKEGRPVVGGLVLSSQRVSLHRQDVRIAAHDIAHALGFAYGNMKSKGMTGAGADNHGKTGVVVVKSPNVMGAARQHFACNSIEGMELEDGEFKGTGKDDTEMLSHWERRNAKDDLMAFPAEPHGDAFLGLYTALTLAAFEDLGYYKAKYDMAEPMTWGRGAGCDFLSHDCKEHKEEAGSKFPAMFCSEKTKENFVCTSDRQSIGKCTLADHFDRDFTPLARSEFQAFFVGSGKDSNDNGQPNAGTASRDMFLTDFCPVVSSMMVCNEVFYEPFTLPESLYGAQAWCLDTESLKEKNGGNGKDIYAVCAEIRCENKAVTVRFQGQKDSVECPYGASVAPPSDKYMSGGHVKCPKYEEVCTVNIYGGSLVTPNASTLQAWKKKGERAVLEATEIIKERSDAM